MMSDLFASQSRILVTGGAGFIGSCLLRRLLQKTNSIVFNLDKLGYASDSSSIQALSASDRYQLLKVDLFNEIDVREAIKQANPDLVMHLAAESHVDRSIDAPQIFLQSNIVGTFNLLQAIRSHWEGLPDNRQKDFRMHHISTDEVYGSLGETGSFSENTSYDPRSPYSATKAASDHLVRAWHHTYGLPIVITNCSNNYGPWQFPEKLIPLVILKAIRNQSIPIYGNGLNVRDWLYVEDHIDALLLAATKGVSGESYCIGGNGERTNRHVVELICSLLQRLNPKKYQYSQLISFVKDRPGHDLRYSINSSKIQNELGWKPKHSFEDGIKQTIIWYLENLEWCDHVLSNSGYRGNRIGTIS